MKQEVESGRPQIEVREPRLFGPTAVIISNVFATLALVPVLVVLAVVVLLLVETEAPRVVLVVLLQLVIAMAIYFLPFGLGNPYVTHLVKLFAQPTPARRRQFIVQATLHPRLRTGLRAFAEDADDVGVLTFDDADLVFEGDSTTIRLPLKQVSSPELKNIGWRGFWLAGQRITIGTRDLPGISSVEFGERSSWTILKSRRITHELHELLEFHVQRHKPL